MCLNIFKKNLLFPLSVCVKFNFSNILLIKNKTKLIEFRAKLAMYFTINNRTEIPNLM